MMNISAFNQKLAKVFRHWEQKEFDTALHQVEAMRKVWPANAHLLVLWAKLVQLQEKSDHSLADARKAMQQAVEVDKTSPAAAIELGYFLDNVEDNPKAALDAFADGVHSARRLLIDGLLGQASALLQLNKKNEAYQCLVESLYLAGADRTELTNSPTEATPDMLLRDPAGRLLAFQLKGPFAMKIEELLQEVFPKQSA